MRTKRNQYNDLISLTSRPINFNKNCGNYNSIIQFYSSPMGSNLSEPYKRMDKNRMVSIVARCMQSGKLDPKIYDRAKDMLKNLGIQNI
jgi:GTP cyclohydrolase II